MRLNITLAAVAAVTFVASAAFAADTLVEGWEAASPTFIRHVGSPPPQNMNCPGADTSVNTDATYITEGVQSEKCVINWAGNAEGPDAYEIGAPTQVHWALRGHWTPTTPLSKNATYFRIDVYNNSDFAVDAAIMVHDGAYKRHPWATLTPHAWTTVQWDIANDPVHPAVTGQATSPLNPTATWLWRGLAIHTTTQPTGASELYFDNMRYVTGQDDNDPPSAPLMAKVEQGSAAGKAKVTWYANEASEGVAKYTVKVLPAAAYGSAIANRLNYADPYITTTDFDATATSGEVDVIPGEVSYIFMTATDGATPNPNESIYNPALVCCLAPDGSAAKYLYVPELKRWKAGDQSAVTMQYEVNLVTYWGPAFAANSLYFGSANYQAVQDGTQALTPNPEGFVVWENGLDSLASNSPMEDASCAKLTEFVNAGGKLVVSGAFWLPALVDEASTQTLKDLATALNTGYNAAAATNKIDFTGFETFGDIGVVYTGADIWNIAAGYCDSGSALVAGAGATAVGNFKDASDANIGTPMVVNDNKTIALGFCLPQIRHVVETSNDLVGAQAARAAVLQACATYLTPASAVVDWSVF